MVRQGPSAPSGDMGKRGVEIDPVDRTSHCTGYMGKRGVEIDPVDLTSHCTGYCR